MTVLVFAVVIALVLFLAVPRGPIELPPPWCGAKKGGYYRCHKPVGHDGPHLCDDWTGEVTWTDDSEKKDGT